MSKNFKLIGLVIVALSLTFGQCASYCDKVVCASPSEYPSFNHSQHMKCGLRKTNPDGTAEIHLKPCGKLTSQPLPYFY